MVNDVNGHLFCLFFSTGGLCRHFLLIDPAQMAILRKLTPAERFRQALFMVNLRKTWRPTGCESNNLISVRLKHLLLPDNVV